jgi:hypothetical protein
MQNKATPGILKDAGVLLVASCEKSLAATTSGKGDSNARHHCHGAADNQPHGFVGGITGKGPGHV